MDLYFMHRDNIEVPVGEFVDVLDEHQRAGRIHAFGGSNWTVERLTEANAYATTHGRHGLVALSNNFSLARMVEAPWAGCLAASDPESRQWLTEHQLPLFPWSSQARRVLYRTVEPRGPLGSQARTLLVQRRQLHPQGSCGVAGPAARRLDRRGRVGVKLTPEEVRWLDLRD